MEWFTKSLFPPTTKDVSKGVVVTKEKVIARAQYLDLVYSQSGMPYDKITNALRPSNNLALPLAKESHVVDGMIGSIS